MKWEEWTSVAQDVALWENHEEPGLLKVEWVYDYVLRLWFEDDIDGLGRLDGSIYELDFYPLMVTENPGGVFLALKDQERFQFVIGDYALVWPNPQTGAHDDQAIDLAPECVRFFCKHYGKRLKTHSAPLPVARVFV